MAADLLTSVGGGGSKCSSIQIYINRDTEELKIGLLWGPSWSLLVLGILGALNKGVLIS